METVTTRFAAGRQNAAPTPRRRALVVAVTIALLVAVNLTIGFGPAKIGLIAGPAVAVVLVGLARRMGLTWHDLGLSKHTWRKGAAYAGVALLIVGAIYVIGALLPLTSTMFLDVRYDIAIGSALFLALVIIPIKTVLLEEIAFRGVLLGLFRRPLGAAWAAGASSALFGLWHILPALGLGSQNKAVDAAAGPGSQLLVVAGVVAFTALAGVLFAELRRRSGSILASAGLHWATNGLGVLLSSVLWAAKTV
ncbi:MAG: CPBP family intramembrane metalloprotease [Actinophytocola sp.]|nr:CPBP family intramembrane metalloprotease [Actinophytocola sp.]